ncbi:MAG TPA: M14 family metallopeptidase [Pyrinomonadaceae bacterium]|nr:M14 family metallopeptidase [Pyrinomonadaceae bacterium]
MRRRFLFLLVALVLLSLTIQGDAIHRVHAQPGVIPEPKDVLGFTPGDDRKLASWAKVVEYFQKLAATSDRVKFAEIGKSTMGAPFIYVTISAPENLKRLDEFKEIQRQLADPRMLADGIDNADTRSRGQAENASWARQNWPRADRKATDLVKAGKTVVAITCGIHSTEVGSYLSSMLIAYRLASSNEPEIQEILKNTIILLVPSTNPDGVDIVNNWYQRTLGTPYEGTDPPELYHKYSGHDDNRDWYAFTQVETQLVVDKILNVWHPQIVHDIHQQGAFGSRLFLPPYMQPVEPNVPRQIVEGYTELGNYLAKEMRATGYKGITTDSTYDAWSPSRAYSHYHGGVRILQETASCRLATPITVKFEQLRPGEGYDPRKEAPNFGPVWQGGEWHIRDITNTMTTVAFLLLKHAAQNREHWLQRFYEIEKEAVRPRKNGEIFGYLIVGGGVARQTLYATEAGRQALLKRESERSIPDSPSQNPQRLIRALLKGGVEVTQIRGVEGDGFNRQDSVFLIRIDQPYGAFARTVLEAQAYPNLRNASGQPQQPYDVTAHTLPLLMNVKVVPVKAPFAYRYEVEYMSAFMDGEGTSKTRLAVYKSHVPAIDEGWTRWTLQNIPLELAPRMPDPPFPARALSFTSLEDSEARSGGLFEKYTTIIIPDQARAAILNGHRKGTMPDEYTGGLGAEGVKALREFVEQGGTLVCLNRASDFAIEQFKLPVRDVVDGLARTDFYVPGSILRIELDTSNPFAAGMPKESIAWVENSPVFEIVNDISLQSGPNVITGRFFPPYVHVIARYPSDKDPLLSGWLLGGDRIKGKAALVEVTLGKGRIILFGFRPQYRGQSLATYPLFFNAITQR